MKRQAPTSNIQEVISIGQEIEIAKTRGYLQSYYDKHEIYPHPYVQCSFGIQFLIIGDKLRAKDALLRGSSYGIEYPCDLYDHAFVDSIGQCFTHLLVHFKPKDLKENYRATELAYLYLSRCIDLFENRAYDSYKSRGILFGEHSNQMAVNEFFMINAMGSLKEIYILSDYYYSAKDVNSPYKEYYNHARNLQLALDDISVGGKDANEYVLEELAELGKRRHEKLFSELERKYKEGSLNMSYQQLMSAFG